MAQYNCCPNCGDEMPADAPHGLCPACLLCQGLESEAKGVSGPAAPGVTAPHHPKMPRASMLAFIKSLFGEVPSILLRDIDARIEPPIVRPSSPEMPEDQGRYQILGEIGHGGMGAVLKGRDPDLGRDLALKVLLDEWHDHTEVKRRFVEEAQIGGQLQHPGIVPVYELGAFDDGRPYFTMKLVKGRTLAALLKDRPSPAHDLPRFLSIFEDICQTMAYAHARGVIHRDLKPSNIMVGAFGEVQVMDWGLAKVLPQGGVADEPRPHPDEAVVSVIRTVRSGSDADKSRRGSLMGTPAYMPPEQAGGDIEAIDERADVFGLGSILCEILTGLPAYVGLNYDAVERKAKRGDTAEALRRLDGCGADGELVALARDCLAAEPLERPREAGELARRITAYVAGVQERLRSAELARAAEEARAEEAIATAAEAERARAAEEARAEEEKRGRELADQLAGEALARASSERKRRRTTVGLAASILALAALGGSTWLVSERSRALRYGAADLALGEAKRLHQLARDSERDDRGRWAEAVAALERAEGLLAQGGDPEQKREADQLKNELSGDRETARKEAEWTARLVDIRSSKGSRADGASSEAEYAAVFREAGIDPDAESPEVAAGRIRSRKPELARALWTALDEWASVRRTQRNDSVAARRLLAVARVADPDRWRGQLRSALDQPGGQDRLKSLRDLAGTAQVDELPVVSLDLLGVSLLDEGDAAAAAGLLRKAQRIHSRDGWLKYNLARALHTLGRTQDAIRYFMAARTIHPETAHGLGHLLEENGESDEAIAVFRDLNRLRPKDPRNLYCLGRALKSQGRKQEADPVLDAAIVLYREQILRNPQDSFAHLMAGQALAAKGNLGEAVAQYQTLIRLNPEDADNHLRLGGVLQAQGKVDEAIDEYRTAIKLKPDYAEAHIALGTAVQNQGKQNEAIEEYRTAIRLKPDDAGVRHFFGQALLAQGKLSEANEELRAVLRLNPDSVGTQLYLGVVLWDQGKHSEAIDELRTVTRLKPDLAAAHFVLGLVLEQQGKRSEAIEEYRTAIRLDPDAAMAHDALGRALWAQGKHTDAIDEYRTAIRLEPDYAEAHHNLGSALEKQGKHAEAIEELRAAIALKPDDVRSRVELGAILCDEQHDYDAAIVQFRAAIQIKPDAPVVHFNLGNALKGRKKLDEAIAAYREAIRLKPDFAKAHVSIGGALVEQGNLDEGIAQCREAIRLKPELAEGHLVLGTALAAQGHTKEAIAECRDAIRLKPGAAAAQLALRYALEADGQHEAAVAALPNPDDFVAHYTSAVQLRERGKLEEAIAEFRSAIRVKPDFGEAFSDLGALLCDEKHEYAEAERELRTAVRLLPDNAIAHNNLGSALKNQGKLTEAIAQYGVAIRLDPNFAGAHANLADTLKTQGLIDEAIAEYRTAIRIKPDDPGPRVNLGAILCDVKRDYDAAIVEFRHAIRLKAENAMAHNNLGVALNARQDATEAITEFRIAIQLEPDLALAHNNLGNTLLEKGDFGEAIREYRTVIRLKPDEYLPHRNLGLALRQFGDYAGSLAETRRAHELGSRQADWQLPSAEWVAEAERMVALAPRLEAVFKGDDRPRDKAERLCFAQMAYDRRHFAAAARLWAEVVAADPVLEANRNAQHLYNAACAAALAAAGQGTDVPSADAAARARLRGQALGWLKAELAAWAKVADSGRPEGVTTIVKTLQHWRKDRDLVGIRDPAALGKLPPDEQKAFTALWTDVDALLKRSGPPALVAQNPTAGASRPAEAKATEDGKEPARHVVVHEPARPQPIGASAEYALGMKRKAEGKPEEALAAFRRGIDGVPPDAVFAQGARKEIRELEATIALAKRWSDVLKGKDRPRDTADRLAFAQLAHDRGQLVAAVRFWAEAFVADPKLGADRDAQRLYHAAHTAVLAAEGKGKDDPPPDDQAKARLRAQAVEWLKADLAAWAKVVESGSDQDRLGLIRALLQWKTEPDFAGIRDPEARKKLPEEEQKAWRTLWASVDTVLKPEDCWAHTNLGEALNAQGNREEAAAEFRKAVRLAPYEGAACYRMALAMRDQSHVEPAIELLRRAVKWDGENLDHTGPAIWTLGETLRTLARYDEAIATYRQIAGLPRANPEDRRKTDEEISLTEAQRRSHVARAAALAGCGQGKDNPPPDETAKAKLRVQALDWLNTELANLAKLHESGPGENRPRLIRTLEYWKNTPDLAGVRDGEALKKLSLEEQRAWRTLWAGVETLLNPDDAWNHVHLGEALNAQGNREQAAAEFRKAVRLAPYDGVTCYIMGLAVRDQAHTDQAIELLSRAAQWDFEKNEHVGLAIGALADTLRNLGRYDEAVANFRRIPKFPHAGPDDVRWADEQIVLTDAYRRSHGARAAALTGCGLGRDNPPPDQKARAKLRAQALDWFTAELHAFAKATELGASKDDPAMMRALEHWKSVQDLAGVRDAEALLKLPAKELKAWRVLWARVETQLKPDDPWNHTHLGEALNAQGNRQEAAAEFRKAVSLASNEGGVCFPMGLAIRDQGYPESAMELFRRTMNWDMLHFENPGGGIWELGRTLRTVGRFDDAIATFRRIREMNRAGPDDVRRADQEITATEGERSLMSRLSEVLKGKQPADAAQAAALAQFASSRALPATAARLWSLALANDPKSSGDRQASPRYDAARAAALAGCGQGKDEPRPDEAARAKLRAQSLEWLKTELGAWSGALDKKPAAPERVPVVRVLEYWKADPDLAGVRDSDALAELPETERKTWQALWADVEALLKKAKGN